METKRQTALFTFYLTSGLLYDRLHELAAEYSLPVEQLSGLAVERLIRDVEFVWALHHETVSRP